MIDITFPDGSVKQYEQGVTGLDIAKSISPQLAKEVLACKVNDEIVFEFYGNGFLYNQVRIMVATLLEIGNGKRPVHDFLRLYKVKDRSQARQTAPASGLYLKEVYYDEEDEKL